jgi:putative tricarboxylic transport membrane protein
MTSLRHFALTTVAAAGLAFTFGVPAVAQVRQLEIIAPSGPGSGWDQASRAIEDTLKAADLSNRVKVTNINGAGGTVGLSQFISSKKGRGDTVLTCGFTLVSSPIVNKSPVTLNDTVPVTRLAGEYEVVVVESSSDIKSFKDVVDRFKKDAGSIQWGGGGVGGTDHVLAALVAKNIGADPKAVNFIPHNGGGELTAALLGKHVTLGIAGWQEFAQHVKSGAMRVIGVAAPERVSGIDAPTLKEQGVDVVLANWRGVVAPPGISEKDLSLLEQTFEKLVQSNRWKDIVKERGWIDLHLGAADFKTFITEQTKEVGAVLRDLGMTN